MLNKEYKSLEDLEMHDQIRMAIKQALLQPDHHWNFNVPSEGAEDEEQLKKQFKLRTVVGRVYPTPAVEDGTYYLDQPQNLPSTAVRKYKIAGKWEAISFGVQVWPLVVVREGKASVTAEHWEVDVWHHPLEGEMQFDSDNYLSLSGIDPDSEERSSIYMIEWWTDPKKFAQSLREAADALEAYHRSYPGRDIKVVID